jgi:hypothetical protein
LIASQNRRNSQKKAGPSYSLGAADSTVFHAGILQKEWRKGIARKIQASQGCKPMNDIDIWKWVALRNGQCGYVSLSLVCLS